MIFNFLFGHGNWTFFFMISYWVNNVAFLKLLAAPVKLLKKVLALLHVPLCRTTSLRGKCIWKRHMKSGNLQWKGMLSLSLGFSFILFSMGNLDSSSLNWFIELYALFCFGNQHYMCFVDQIPMFLAQLHNKRKLLMVALGKGIFFSSSTVLLPISIGCLLMVFMLAYLGRFFFNWQG